MQLFSLRPTEQQKIIETRNPPISEKKHRCMNFILFRNIVCRVLRFKTCGTFGRADYFSFRFGWNWLLIQMSAVSKMPISIKNGLLYQGNKSFYCQLEASLVSWQWENWWSEIYQLREIWITRNLQTDDLLLNISSAKPKKRAFEYFKHDGPNCQKNSESVPVTNWLIWNCFVYTSHEQVKVPGFSRPGHVFQCFHSL